MDITFKLVGIYGEKRKKGTVKFFWLSLFYLSTFRLCS